MDTKLTKNKIIKELGIIILVILMIFSSISLKLIYTRYTRLKMDYGYNYLDSGFAMNNLKSIDSGILEYIALYKDIEGNKKEDVYNKYRKHHIIKSE